jgi:hypothetical protein
MRTSLALLRTGIFAVCLGAQPREDRVVILIEVLDLLTLFSIVRVEFTYYASSERATLRVEDTGLLLAAGGCLLAGRLGRRLNRIKTRSSSASAIVGRLCETPQPSHGDGLQSSMPFGP